MSPFISRIIKDGDNLESPHPTSQENMWYKRKTAYNSETGQSHNVISGVSEWNNDLYPSMFFAHFNAVKQYNTYTLLFPMLEEQEEIIKFTGNDKGEIDIKTIKT
jgi:hypothetical protein